MGKSNLPVQPNVLFRSIPVNTPCLVYQRQKGGSSIQDDAEQKNVQIIYLKIKLN